MGAMIQAVRTPLGTAYRTIRAPTYYLRAKRILSAYSAHHAEARAAFLRDGGRPDPRVPAIADVGVRIVDAGGPAPLLRVPDRHRELVAAIGREVDERLAWTTHCTFFPAVAPTTAARTADVAEVAAGQVIVSRLARPLDLPTLEAIAAPILDEFERHVYASYVLLDKVYVYRSLVGRQQAQRSWLWHFDNHPREILKVMIYLTDVTDTTAPFQYLRAPRSGTPVPGSPLAPLYGSGRVPREAIDRQLAAGCEVCTVTGPAGTTILFDDNVLHRAVLAETAPRDVLVLQVRPATFKARPCADPRWTGSFEHADFPEHPAVTSPSTRPNVVFQR